MGSAVPGWIKTRLSLHEAYGAVNRERVRSRLARLNRGILCALIAVISWVSIVWLNPATPDQAATVAALWVSMTVAFEFGFGHFVAGKPWAVLLADYNILQGRIWVLVPVTVASAPYLTARLRGLF